MSEFHVIPNRQAARITKALGKVVTAIEALAALLPTAEEQAAPKARKPRKPKAEKAESKTVAGAFKGLDS